MSEQPYKQPPITEAVIELRFATAIETDDITKVSAALKSLYPLQQPNRGIEVRLNVPPPGQQGVTAAHPIETHGNRLSTEDQTQIVLVWPAQFVFSQLAPYPGWDVFFERFCRDWAVWKRTLGYRKITRIGVRYINRIDIPATAPIIEHEEYLNIYPHMPMDFQSLMAYSVVAQLPLPDIGCILTLNSSSAPSQLLGHAAFIVDQDIAKDGDPPQNDEGIYTLLNQIRVKKNEVFEACIKPRARELFKPCRV
jgi:uncharacterized protein (TIGR04255 family)